ncbi:MAG TPA: hypothetical protein VNN12_08340 [Dehalococcoidia bacterium]|nr:hypothetical protein [Dehalococcoidia bacterium]
MSFEEAALALPALALVIERLAEAAVGALWPEAPPDARWAGRRRALAILLTIVAAFALVVPLRIDLTDPLFGADAFGTAQGVGVTALLLAGGAGPAHAIVRALESLRPRGGGARL